MWRALRTTKPPHFNQQDKTHTHTRALHDRHARTSRKPTRTRSRNHAQTRRKYKNREGWGVKQRLSHLAGWDMAEIASVRCSFPAAQPFNGRYPTAAGQILVFFISHSTYCNQRGFTFPPPPPSTSLTPKLLLCSLPLQDWCFLFIKHQADIPWI